jgi:uncharacterized surface anchored protein
MPQVHSRATRIAAALIATAAHCLTCTVAQPVIPVAASFRVKVQDRGHNVQGLGLVLTPQDDQTKHTSLLTDKDGIVSFRDLPPGFYNLVADHDDFWSKAGVGLFVSVDGPSDVTVPLSWPSIRSLTVRSLRGMLYAPIDPGGPNPPPAPNVPLELIDALSGRSISTTQTTSIGDFLFDDPKPALYFIKLGSSRAPELSGMIAVDLSPGAQTDHLDLASYMTSCGMMYADMSQCPRSELRLQYLRGRVADIPGTSIRGADLLSKRLPSADGYPIANAEILLYDSDGRLVERTSTDDDGQFGTPHTTSGTYRLVVKRDGFSTLRTTVHLTPFTDPSPHGQVQIELGAAGSCSAAYAR